MKGSRIYNARFEENFYIELFQLWLGSASSYQNMKMLNDFTVHGRLDNRDHNLSTILDYRWLMTH